MEIQKSISKNIKNDISKILNNIEYDKRILFIIKNYGHQRFSDLEQKCNMSKSTLSKYIKLNLQKNNIEKKIHEKSPFYFLTEKGIEKLNEDYKSKEENLFFINIINEVALKTQELINFYKDIGVEESILFQILKNIVKIGEKFFQLNQNRELFLALFYMFLNSVLTPEYKFEVDAFCKYYNVKKLRIDYYVDSIMSSKFGFFMFKRDEDVFFFHEEDILGTTTLRLIKDQLIEEIIHIDLKGYREIYDLDNFAEKIAEKLIKMDLIWDRIREPFEMLIEKLIIKKAMDMGISKTFLMDMVVQSEKLSKSREGINSLINIINGSEKYEDLNIVSLHHIEDKKLDDIIDKIKGFCPECGKSILKQDFSNECPKCKRSFEKINLLSDIDEAVEISIKYKQKTKEREKLIICPNPKCDAKISLSWDECPSCNTKFGENKL
ncbi:MAG: hypothetical protein JXA99_05250 [Candidatus Lokiarchaeota archaeon]|nr:hypothetical protein [Candidatus Lokiarchaeota archaeon]